MRIDLPICTFHNGEWGFSEKVVVKAKIVDIGYDGAASFAVHKYLSRHPKLTRFYTVTNIETGTSLVSANSIAKAIELAAIEMGIPNIKKKMLLAISNAPEACIT